MGRRAGRAGARASAASHGVHASEAALCQPWRVVPSSVSDATRPGAIAAAFTATKPAPATGGLVEPDSQPLPAASRYRGPHHPQAAWVQLDLLPPMRRRCSFPTPRAHMQPGRGVHQHGSFRDAPRHARSGVPLVLLATAGSWRPGRSAPWWARSSNSAAEFPPAALKQQKQTREAEMACRLDNPSCNTAHACGAGGKWGVWAVGARTPEAQADQMRPGPPQMVHQPCSRTQDALTCHTHASDSGMCRMCSPPAVQSTAMRAATH